MALTSATHTIANTRQQGEQIRDAHIKSDSLLGSGNWKVTCACHKIFTVYRVTAYNVALVISCPLNLSFEVLIFYLYYF